MSGNYQPAGASSKSRAKVNTRRVHPYVAARRFYEEKLENNPTMPRYLHFMSAMTAEKGEVDTANSYYRRAIESDPNNIMVRNDYAVHLARNNRKEDALNEFRKARIIIEDNAVLEKNTAAVLGNTGRYQEALDAATRSRFLNPNDAQNHRNIAKLQSALGDGRAALHHNMKSIAIEHSRNGDSWQQHHQHAKPNTSAHRAAAVQIIAQGGSREDAFKLMDTARTLENKRIDLLTSTRTYEIIADIKRRYGGKLFEQEKKRQEEEERRKAYEAEAQAYLEKRLRQKRKK